ncbi:hypothetical protein BDZ89DRAFT_334450 [Hymenopellis radicata]|nr:hypothetical protein BDZ89DRAFT_334450 [Hymenopellis radicata]
MVCGVASRVSRDSRVLLSAEHSAGWKWVSQTLGLHTSLFESARLYDIQYCCLLSEYVLGSSTPQSTWFIIGQGMRYAIELSLHRRRGDEKPTVQGELNKRIF